MAIDKSKWNTNIKVSQKTIDEIKKMGMAKALKTVAGSSAASKQDSSAAAWTEGVKRLYGANRVAAAVKSGKVKYTSPDAARGAATAKPTVKYSTADSAKNAAAGKSTTKYKSADSAKSSQDAINKAKADWYAGKRDAKPTTKKSPSKPKAKVTSLAPTRKY